MLINRVKFIFSLFLLHALIQKSFGKPATMPAIYNGDEWISVVKYDDTPVLPPISDSWKSPSTEIYIAISHFRDSKRCSTTLKNIFSNAEFPDRIVIGIVEQLEEDEKECLVQFCNGNLKDCKESKQVRSIFMAKYEAKGPSFSRSLHAGTSFLSNPPFPKY